MAETELPYNCTRLESECDAVYRDHRELRTLLLEINRHLEPSPIREGGVQVIAGHSTGFWNAMADLHHRAGAEYASDTAAEPQ